MLARKISDHFLPEVFWNNTTFDESDGAPSRSKEEEETLALSLSVRIKTDIEAKNDDDEN
jgi:hypothetical protein